MSKKKIMLTLGALAIAGGAYAAVGVKKRVDMLRFQVTHFWFKKFSQGLQTFRVYVMVDNHHHQPFFLKNLLMDIKVNTGPKKQDNTYEWQAVGSNPPWKLRTQSPLAAGYQPTHPLDFIPGRKQLQIDFGINPAMVANWIGRPDKMIKIAIQGQLPNSPMISMGEVAFAVPNLLDNPVVQQIGDKLGINSLLEKLGLQGQDLGFIPAAIRPVYPREDFYQYYPPLSVLKNKPLTRMRGSVYHTVQLMHDKVPSWAWQTVGIARYLKAPNALQTLKHNFSYLVNHFRFIEDKNGEEVKCPLQVMALGEGDCDCLSMKMGTLLYNQGIPFYFRMSAYEKPEGRFVRQGKKFVLYSKRAKPNTVRSDGWQHIYVVALVQGKEYVLDFNIGEFNVEKEALAIENFPLIAA